MMRPAVVVGVRVDDEVVEFTLADGRRLACPTSWSYDLDHATKAEREHFEIEPCGAIVAWPDLDEHIGVWTMLGVPEEDVLARPRPISAAGKHDLYRLPQTQVTG